jgi:hypothetical protein
MSLSSSNGTEIKNIICNAVKVYPFVTSKNNHTPKFGHRHTRNAQSQRRDRIKLYCIDSYICIEVR